MKKKSSTSKQNNVVIKIKMCRGKKKEKRNGANRLNGRKEKKRKRRVHVLLTWVKKRRKKEKDKRKRMKSMRDAGIDDRINEKSARCRGFVCKRTIKNSHTIHSSPLASPGKNQARIGRLTGLEGEGVQ